jgi:AraC-like DNA-binding protein
MATAAPGFRAALGPHPALPVASQFYIPVKPHAAIHSVWQIDDFIAYSYEQIVPKGVTEIIFNFGEGAAIEARIGTNTYSLARCFVNGFNTMPVSINLPRHQSFFGVRLQPLAIKKMLNVPAGEFMNTSTDLLLVSPALNALWHRLAEETDFYKRVTIIESWSGALCSEWLAQEQLLNDFLCASDQHELSVKQLAGNLCYSPRHLSRKVKEATGLNTEELLLYKKYLHAVHLIHYSALSLTQVAYQSCFSDQSHFIKTFRHFTSMTPGDYQRSKSALMGHIYHDVR